MITRDYLLEGNTWFYEGMAYYIKKYGHLWAINGLDGGTYGNVNWFGEDMLKADCVLFGRMHAVTLLYEDMSTSKI